MTCNSANLFSQMINKLSLKFIRCTTIVFLSLFLNIHLSQTKHRFSTTGTFFFTWALCFTFNRKAVELSPENPHILMRCARGLMKLPPCLKDLKFTKECIDKALEMAPNNPMIHHVQAMYHERFDCVSSSLISCVVSWD
jgi:hypothetical protein